MRKASVLLVAVLTVLAVAANRASAEEGSIPRSTLAALGLSEMEIVSDWDGMGVRGMSSLAVARGASLVFGMLVDPSTPGNFFVASDTNGNRATVENGGYCVRSTANSGPHGSSAAGVMTIESGNPAVIVYDGTFAGNAGHAANIGHAGIAFGSAR